jgi:N-acetyl-gamma-glutamylphosphate reductase
MLTNRKVAPAFSTRPVTLPKRHGFAGVSLEARAVKTANKELYDLAYRLYSGHVHATEIHEQLIRRLNPELSKGFEESLLPAVRGISVDCVTQVVDRLNR